MNNSLQKTPPTQTEKRRHQESIVITKCLTPECTGFYTDSISEYFLIKCLDPEHNIDEVGHQPTPDADATTATQPAKLGSVIKWNIQQS
jgi:hypothetical protein